MTRTICVICGKLQLSTYNKLCLIYGWKTNWASKLLLRKRQSDNKLIACWWPEYFGHPCHSKNSPSKLLLHASHGDTLRTQIILGGPPIPPHTRMLVKTSGGQDNPSDLSLVGRTKSHLGSTKWYHDDDDDDESALVRRKKIQENSNSKFENYELLFRTILEKTFDHNNSSFQTWVRNFTTRWICSTMLLIIAL